MDNFPVKEENKEANGGDAFSGEKKSELTSYTEYNRHQGSDGFSKSHK